MESSLDFSQTPAGDGGGVVMAGLHTCGMLARLPDPVLAPVAAKTQLRDYEEGQVLCHQGDIAHTVWLVLDGWVKLTRETLDGEEAVWDVLGSGHLVGLETLTAPHQYTTRAVAVTDVSLLAIPHNVLRALLEKQPQFAMELLGHALRQQQEERLDMEHRTQQTAPQRIGCFLLQLAGTPEQGVAVLNLPFDKGLLAARLGMQPETFSRALAKLKAEAGVEMEGARMKLDVARVTQYTCGACSGSYPCR